MFNIGDRVTTVTDDSYNGLSGAVESRTTSSTLVDYTVLLDGKTNALSFCEDELRAVEEFPVGTKIRLKRSVSEFPAGTLATVSTQSEYAYGNELTIEFANTAERYFIRPGEFDTVETDLVLTVSVPEEYYPVVTRAPSGRWDYRFEGDYTIAVEEVPATVYVQVSYAPPGEYAPYGPYTYVDPSGTLAVGDEVIVPVSYGEKPGRVVALGRGTWQGECKTVSCRVVREPLA